jgi:hypothetical protein
MNLCIDYEMNSLAGALAVAFKNPSHVKKSSGNLAPGAEERKLLALEDRFVACFGFGPRVCRSGRHGLSQASAALLKAHGFDVGCRFASLPEMPAPMRPAAGR